MDDDTGSAFYRVLSDLMLLMFAAMALSVVMLVPMVAKKVTESAEVTQQPPGTVIVTADWDPNSDVDVDLWVRAPGDTPVGYSAKSGVVFNLLRDDLGQIADASHLNAEVAYARGYRAGTYVVNVHLYRLRRGDLPLPVRVVVSIQPEGSESPVQMWSGDVVLTKEGQELTAVRFVLDAQGRLVPDSVDQVQVPVRSAK